MALIRFSYVKLVKPNQQTFSPGAATTWIEGKDVTFSPLGAAGTTAPSTLIQNNVSNVRYFTSIPYSAVNAVLSAVTSDSGQILLV